MKNFILIIVSILLGQLSVAQVTDTLGFADFYMGAPALYSSPNGGYAFGNNGYDDKAKAQSYVIESPFVLREVLLHFGDVNFASGDSSSVIRVNVYDNHGPGITSFGTGDSIAPDSVLSYVDIPVYMLTDDGSFSTASFAHDTVVITQRFSVGIDLTYLSAGDTVGLTSSTDGDAMGALNAWEKTSNNDWFTVEHAVFSWGLDVDFAIFPVIDENDPAGISARSIPAFSLSPNPCTNEIQISSQAIPDRITIVDVSGRVLIDLQTESPLDSVVDVGHLPAGFYFAIMRAKDQIVSLPFVKQ